MNVIKVIVDEMPEYCGSCHWLHSEYYSACLLSLERPGLSEYGDLGEMKYKGVDRLSRPLWCPLVTTDWVLNELHSPFRNWNWDEDIPQDESEVE